MMNTIRRYTYTKTMYQVPPPILIPTDQLDCSIEIEAKLSYTPIKQRWQHLCHEVSTKANRFRELWIWLQTYPYHVDYHMDYFMYVEEIQQHREDLRNMSHAFNDLCEDYQRWKQQYGSYSPRTQQLRMSIKETLLSAYQHFAFCHVCMIQF